MQPYYCRIAEIHALRDDVKPFIRSYFNTIPSLVNAENLSFCEHFANYGAWNKTHETGWFLCQTRLMFVMERGDELWLAPFVTGDWLKNGGKVIVRNAPTDFGKVSYELAATADDEIEATVKLPAHFTARKVVLRLRHPDGKPIKSVTVQGRKHTDFDPRETITGLAKSTRFTSGFELRAPAFSANSPRKRTICGSLSSPQPGYIWAMRNPAQTDTMASPVFGGHRKAVRPLARESRARANPGWLRAKSFRQYVLAFAVFTAVSLLNLWLGDDRLVRPAPVHLPDWLCSPVWL